jgi:TRAP-type C4-dicarboxylate transport system permease small subunit
MKLAKKFNTIFDRILDFMVIVAAILAVITTLVVAAGIFSRYFLNRPLVWTSEISGYILLYICFLVAAWVLKEEGHVKMDLVLSKLNPRAQSMMNIVTSAINTIVCLILTWYGAKVTWDLFRTHYFTPTILELPKFIFTIAIFIGGFTLSIQFLRRTYGNLTRLRESPAKEQGSG